MSGLRNLHGSDTLSRSGLDNPDNNTDTLPSRSTITNNLTITRELDAEARDRDLLIAELADFDMDKPCDDCSCRTSSSRHSTCDQLEERARNALNSSEMREVSNVTNAFDPNDREIAMSGSGHLSEIE